MPLDAFAAGLGDHRIHRFPLARIEEAYELFANQRDGVVKVAITHRGGRDRGLRRVAHDDRIAAKCSSC